MQNDNVDGRTKSKAPSPLRCAGALRIDHIGIATNDLDQMASLYRDALGLNVVETEEVPSQKVRVAMLPLGESRIELLEATADDSPISKFLAKRGPGIHHIALNVGDIRASLAELKSKGARLIDEEPRNGAGGCLVAFIHPSSTGGVLIELVERPGGDNSFVREHN